jgi:hypothetical protein
MHYCFWSKNMCLINLHYSNFSSIKESGNVITTLHFFITYVWVQKTGDYTLPERFGSDKHSSLLGPFIIYKGYEVL